MRKLITAAIAAITLLGAGAASVPAMAEGAGAGAGQYHGDRGDDRRDGGYDRRDRRDDRRGDRWDGRSHRGNAWMQHVRRCERTYRSYNRRTDTYRTRYGQMRRCRL